MGELERRGLVIDAASPRILTACRGGDCELQARVVVTGLASREPYSAFAWARVVLMILVLAVIGSAAFNITAGCVVIFCESPI